MCTDNASCCVFDAKAPRKLHSIELTPDDLSASASARFYGFLWHRQIYACAIDGDPLESPQPSRIEDLLGDG